MAFSYYVVKHQLLNLGQTTVFKCKPSQSCLGKTGFFPLVHVSLQKIRVEEKSVRHTWM